MSTPVKWKIPAPFIARCAHLTPCEIAFGYRLGWLTAQDLVDLARQSNGGDRASASLAIDLDDPRSVEALVAALNDACSTTADEQRVWIYLALAWLLEMKASIEDPFEVLEMLFEVFDHSTEFEGLIRWMPPPKGQAFGLPAMEQQWRRRVDRLGSEFRDR